MVIRKDEFCLREVTISDFNDIHEYSKDIENLRYTLWGPNSEDETRGFIDYTINMRKENPRVKYEFAIEIKTDYGYKVIGGCGIFITENPLIGEVGWIINKRYWNRGYGTEVGKALLKFGFEKLNLEKIFATCDSRNIGSYRIMEKCKMKKESLKFGIRKSKEKNKSEDELNYSISREDYQNI